MIPRLRQERYKRSLELSVPESKEMLKNSWKHGKRALKLGRVSTCHT